MQAVSRMVEQRRGEGVHDLRAKQKAGSDTDDAAFMHHPISFCEAKTMPCLAIVLL